MTRYRTVAHLDTAMAAYIAGLVDGEGTVTLTRWHRGENRRLVVSISNNAGAVANFFRGPSAERSVSEHGKGFCRNKLATRKRGINPAVLARRQDEFEH
jgi:hypothetical protein